MVEEENKLGPLVGKEAEEEGELHELLEKEHDVHVTNHLANDEEVECGYCGKPFMGSESRIEKQLYGQKWVFCSEDCLESFKEKSNYLDEDPDMTTGDEDKTGFEINMKFTGPEDSGDGDE